MPEIEEMLFNEKMKSGAERYTFEKMWKDIKHLQKDMREITKRINKIENFLII